MPQPQPPGALSRPGGRGPGLRGWSLAGGGSGTDTPGAWLGHPAALPWARAPTALGCSARRALPWACRRLDWPLGHTCVLAAHAGTPPSAQGSLSVTVPFVHGPDAHVAHLSLPPWFEPIQMAAMSGGFDIPARPSCRSGPLPRASGSHRGDFCPQGTRGQARGLSPVPVGAAAGL